MSIGSRFDSATLAICLVGMAGRAAARRVLVELVYQTVRPDELEELAVVPTPAAVKLTQMANARPPRSVVMATDARDLP